MTKFEQKNRNLKIKDEHKISNRNPIESYECKKKKKREKKTSHVIYVSLCICSLELPFNRTFLLQLKQLVNRE